MNWRNFDAMDMTARERRTFLRALRRLADEATEPMRCVTKSNRRYEEHRCREMPYGYTIRRYGLPTNRFDIDLIPSFVWTIVRLEVPDYWIDGDECHGLALGTAGTEPNFCPWCGERLMHLPEPIRGWDGRDPLIGDDRR